MFVEQHRISILVIYFYIYKNDCRVLLFERESFDKYLVGKSDHKEFLDPNILLKRRQKKQKISLEYIEEKKILGITILVNG